MSPWSSSLAVVALVSALPLIVMSLLARRPDLLSRHVARFIPLAAGALLGAPVFHLLPEALARGGSLVRVASFVGAGALAFLLLDRLLHDGVGRAVLGPSGGARAAGQRPGGPSRVRAYFPLLIIGDAIHNGIDGVLIAATYLDEPTLGIVTGLAVALHEMPRELGTFALMVGAGMTARRALGINVVTAAIAAVAAIATLLMGDTILSGSGALLAFGAGNFFFLSGSLVVTELRHPARRKEVVVRVALFALGLALTFLGQHRH
jgi:zinc and cadmium transporter